MTLVIPFER